MIRDKEPYNAIGRAIVSALAQNWEKVVFYAEVKEKETNWTMQCFFKGRVSGIQTPDLMSQKPEFLVQLETIRKSLNLWNGSCELIFRHDLTYKLSTNRSSIKIKKPDVDRVHRAIRDLHALDLTLAEIDLVKDKLGTLIAGYAINSPIVQKGSLFFRGVKWEGRPQKIADLSYPPREYVKNLHRAGRSGQTLFYCSRSPHAPFFELAVVPGSHVAISHWQANADIVVNNVGYHREVFSSLHSSRDCPSWDRNTGCDKFDKTASYIKKFFATEFAKCVPRGNEYLYKLSIAIAELHFSSNVFGGLLYPSMAMRANADNLAFKPECVDKCLSFQKVEYIRVDKADASGFKITILDVADTFDEHGCIQWKGVSPQWVIREKGQVLNLAVENGIWVARNEKREIVKPEM